MEHNITHSMVLFFSGKHKKRCVIQIHDHKPDETRQFVQQWNETTLLFWETSQVEKYFVWYVDIGWYRDGFDICYYQNNLKRKNGDFFYTLTFSCKFPCNYCFIKMTMIQSISLIAILIPILGFKIFWRSWSWIQKRSILFRENHYAKL